MFFGISAILVKLRYSQHIGRWVIFGFLVEFKETLLTGLTYLCHVIKICRSNVMPRRARLDAAGTLAEAASQLGVSTSVVSKIIKRAD